MTDQNQTQNQLYPLEPTTRWLSGLLGLSLIALSSVALYFPPIVSATRYDRNNKQEYRVATPTNLSSPFIALALSGVGLVIYGLNGFRFTKFLAGNFGADSAGLVSKAQGDLQKESDSGITQNITIDDQQDPVPTENALTSIQVDTFKYSLFKPSDVPLQVISDALKMWPPDIDRPDTPGDLEYGLRQKGKGNHAWKLMFRGSSQLITVSYGGKAKSEPTVRG